MPHLETPEELAEQIADWCGIYGTPTEEEQIENHGHLPECKCRMCFTVEIQERIRESVKNEEKLR